MLEHVGTKKKCRYLSLELPFKVLPFLCNYSFRRFVRSLTGKGLKMDIPIGQLFNGTEVNYMTFVQGSSRDRHVSRIQDMKLSYGSVPGLVLP